MVSSGFPVETHWVLTFTRSSAQFSVCCVPFADFLIFDVISVNISTHDLENLFCNAVEPARKLPVEVIVDRRFDRLRRVTLRHQGEHQRCFPVSHVSGRFVLLFLLHTIPHATVNRRLVQDLMKRSASSGMAFLNAVLSKRRLVTVFHVIL